VDDEVMYRPMSDYQSSWTQEQNPSFELFRLIVDENDPRAVAGGDALTPLSSPFRFYPLGRGSTAQMLEEACLNNSDLPVVIPYDGCVTVNPTLSDMAQAFGVNVLMGAPIVFSQRAVGIHKYLPAVEPEREPAGPATG
jgi:thioredoxin reductase (NADPH)